MERLRKVIASLGVVAILSTLMVTSVANADWWDTYVDELVTAGVLDSADDYRAGDNLTRMELVEFAVAAFSLEGTTAIDFSDVPATHAGYATLQTAVANGVVKGYDDGTFKPDNPVLRSELVKILVEAGDLPECDVDNPFNDVPSSVWYADYAVTAYCNSVIDGYSDGSFGGAKNTARSEAAKMVSVSMTPVVREDVEEEEDEESSELEGGAGSVEEYKLVTSYQNEEVGERVFCIHSYLKIPQIPVQLGCAKARCPLSWIAAAEECHCWTSSRFFEISQLCETHLSTDPSPSTRAYALLSI